MSTALRTYYRGDELVGLRDGQANATRYYHFDHQGTTQCLTDRTGAVTDRFASDAWGVQVKRTGASINRHWYIGNGGYSRDQRKGIEYVRARFLNVNLARWESTDRLTQFPSAYLYAFNSPALSIDPTGEWSLEGKGAATCQDNWQNHTANYQWCGTTRSQSYIKFFCNPHPENPACKLYKPGMTGAFPNVANIQHNKLSEDCAGCPPEQQKTHKCYLDARSMNQRSLGITVECGDSVRASVPGTNCYVDIQIIEAGPAGGQTPNRVVDLHLQAATALYSCLHPGRSIRNCRDFGLIKNVVVSSIFYPI